MDDSNLVAKEKALPAVLQWLSSTYEVARGHALPKREVYTDYVKFCVDHAIEPTNAPAFGKILRMVFPDITSRRLGRRGQTSHHYNHFRRKGEASTNQMRHPQPDPLNRPYSPEQFETENDFPPRYADSEPFVPPSYNQPGGYQYPFPMPERSSYFESPSHPDFQPTQQQQHPLQQQQQQRHHHQPQNFPPQERIGRYLQSPPPQPFAVSMADDSFRRYPAIPPRDIVKMEDHHPPPPPSHISSSLSSLQMGESSFGDEDFLRQEKQFSHSFPSHPYPTLPSQQLPSQFYPPHPSRPPSSQPSAPHQPMDQDYRQYPAPAPFYSRAPPDTVPPASVESSSLKTLIESPHFSLQGAESFNCSIVDIDPRIRATTVPLVICPSSYPASRRTSKGSFSTSTRLSPPDIFPLDVGKVPMFAIDTQQLPYNDLKQEARHFTTMYRNHMQTVFTALTPPLDFDAVYSAVYMFWPQTKRFHRLFSSQCVIDQILEIDAMLYSAMLGLLIPDLFAETPFNVLDSIISFSKSFPSWLRNVMVYVVPFTMYEFKVKVAESFGKALYNRATINQLSIKLRHSLEEEKQEAKENADKPSMLEDWGALDFEYIDNQTWLYGEFKKIPNTVKDNMPVLLSQRVQVEAWSKWLMEVTENVMKGHYAPYTLTVSDFLLKWAMYTSLIATYLIEIKSTNLDLFLLLFGWIEALLALYLDEHEQLQMKRAKARPPSLSLRRASLPGTASFSSLTPTPVGQTLIPNITLPEDDFSDF